MGMHMQYHISLPNLVATIKSLASNIESNYLCDSSEFIDFQLCLHSFVVQERTMDRLISNIQKRYQQRSDPLSREYQWPTRRADRLIQLKLVERDRGKLYFGNHQRGENSNSTITGEQRSLAYEDLFKAESKKYPVRSVLVEGDAGIGKTTFCMSISKDWANGELFQQFKFVLLLPLRHKKVASAASFPELLSVLSSLSRTVCESVTADIEDQLGEGVLIIADGWDELDESHCTEYSFLHCLLYRENLPFLSVLLTSRPAASTSFHALSIIDQFVEIHGFTTENVKNYINSEFAGSGEKAMGLLQQLESNTVLESVCSIPLNCAIVCHLWNALEEALPTSMTKLYTKIILNVAFRNIKKCPEGKRLLSLKNFDSIPKNLQNPWWLLCELAFRTIEGGRIVFSQEDLTEIFPQGLSMDDNIFSFGLLQTSEFDFELGREVSFHFLHLTFQEYLAALYLVKQPYCKQVEMLSAYKILLKQSGSQVIDKQRSSVVWRFFFGLYFNGLVIEDSKSLLSVKDIIETFDPLMQGLALCHCAYEANSEIVSREIVNYLGKYPICTSEGIVGCIAPENAYDCEAMIHIINNTLECDKMSISFYNSGIRDNQIKSLTDALASKDGKLQVVRLDLSFNQLTDECIADLLYRASSAFQSINSLRLIGNKIGADSIQHVTTALARSIPNVLQTLNLSLNPLVVPGVLDLENTIYTGKLSNLRCLGLMGCLSNDADVNGALLTTLMDILFTHCPHMRNFDFSDNNLGVPGAIALGSNMSQFSQHKLSEYFVLSINKTKLGDEGLLAFVNSLQGSFYVDVLELKDNNIHSFGVSYLAKGFFSKKVILKGYTSRFHLDGNPLGLQGTLEIAEVLRISFCCCQYLDRCQLATNIDDQLTIDYSTTLNRVLTAKTVGEKLLAIPRTFSCQIANLHLTGNRFTGEGINILAGLIRLCPNLQSLNSDHCAITSHDLSQLLIELNNVKSFVPTYLFYNLKQWNLSNNKIDNEGVHILAQHLPLLFPSLRVSNQDLQLDNNLISNDELVWLTKELHLQGRAKVNIIT